MDFVAVGAVMWYILYFEFFPFSSNEIKSVPEKVPGSSLHSYTRTQTLQTRWKRIGRWLHWSCENTATQTLVAGFWAFASIYICSIFLGRNGTQVRLWQVRWHVLLFGWWHRTRSEPPTDIDATMWCESPHQIFTNFIVFQWNTGSVVLQRETACVDLSFRNDDVLMQHVSYVHILIYVSLGPAVITGARIIHEFCFIFGSIEHGSEHQNTYSTSTAGELFTHMGATEQWSAWVKEDGDANTIDVLARKAGVFRELN